MKKAIALLTLSLVLTFALCACNSSQKINSPVANVEMEKKLVGKWKFLYTDASQETPPGDLVYILKEDHTSVLEFTDDKQEKRQIEGTFKVVEDRLQFFKGEEKPSKEFQIHFQGNDTVQLTESKTKNSMTLARLPN